MPTQNSHSDVNAQLLVALASEKKNGNAEWRVAQESKVHPSRLSRWKYGHDEPTPEEAERVAAVLGMSVAVLFPNLYEDREAAASDPPEKERNGRARTTA